MVRGNPSCFRQKGEKGTGKKGKQNGFPCPLPPCPPPPYRLPLANRRSLILRLPLLNIEETFPPFFQRFVISLPPACPLPRAFALSRSVDRVSLFFLASRLPLTAATRAFAGLRHNEITRVTSFYKTIVKLRECSLDVGSRRNDTALKTIDRKSPGAKEPRGRAAPRRGKGSRNFRPRGKEGRAGEGREKRVG